MKFVDLFQFCLRRPICIFVHGSDYARNSSAIHKGQILLKMPKYCYIMHTPTTDFIYFFKCSPQIYSIYRRNISWFQVNSESGSEWLDEKIQRILVHALLYWQHLRWQHGWWAAEA